MAPKFSLLLIVLIILSLGAIIAVCLHSLDEIHYLKSFFPRTFSVEEAYYAGALELVKVIVISIPLVLIAIICVIFLRKR